QALIDAGMFQTAAQVQALIDAGVLPAEVRASGCKLNGSSSGAGSLAAAGTASTTVRSAVNSKSNVRFIVFLLQMERN
ncbi:MAG: hypothetical protein OXP73_02095, partial [Chloroflexota bacterium]|nr:hypothetical protein [Chloroflexota bacterium]